MKYNATPILFTMSDAWRHDLLPILSLTGVILNALGGLYLAYDLLGGKHGPLRTFTKSVSYGVMFGSAYGLPLGVWFGLAGLVASGPALSLEIEHRDVRDAHRFVEALAFGLLRAASYGVAGLAHPRCSVWNQFWTLKRAWIHRGIPDRRSLARGHAFGPTAH